MNITAGVLPTPPPALSLRAQFRALMELAKSGIITLVLISVSGGYLLGQPHETPISWITFFLTLCGIMLLSSGSSALNQFQESTLDIQMPRTAKRPLPSGRLTRFQAGFFVISSIAAGLLILGFGVSLRVMLLGVAAVISYNGLYTLWWKRHWARAAIPGAIPGALPILMGYAAASQATFEPGGIYLFLMLFYWQMPHFWVLALKYKDDYAMGGIPTLPVARGEAKTRKEIVLWCLGYVGLSFLAPLFLQSGPWYFALALPISLKVLSEMVQFIKAGEQETKKSWLRFFLWINFSLIGYLAAAVLDRWALHLLTPFWVR